ncbi:hypothetical protein [Mesobacillus jeotgali]|uniref:hypothetical protein n=1 Tax=Mesobacillus jeotgali TaxID=129985 RepID=UPI0013159DD3|nr:hypothetical protein [Mesobacillus jeotgali]
MWLESENQGFKCLFSFLYRMDLCKPYTCDISFAIFPTNAFAGNHGNSCHSLSNFYGFIGAEATSCKAFVFSGDHAFSFHGRQLEQSGELLYRDYGNIDFLEGT